MARSQFDPYRTSSRAFLPQFESSVTRSREYAQVRKGLRNTSTDSRHAGPFPLVPRPSTCRRPPCPPRTWAFFDSGPSLRPHKALRGLRLPHVCLDAEVARPRLSRKGSTAKRAIQQLQFCKLIFGWASSFDCKAPRLGILQLTRARGNWHAVPLRVRLSE